MEPLRLTQSVYFQILDALGSHAPECGGVLGAQLDGPVTEFYFDETGTGSAHGYAPDVQAINALLMHDWMPRGIYMVGIVHSHANGVRVPSCGDIGYGIRILQALDTVDRFYLPIVTVSEHQPELTAYVIRPDPDRQYVCQKIACELCG